MNLRGLEAHSEAAVVWPAEQGHGHARLVRRLGAEEI
jgi:hypothetical protein